MCVGGLDPKYQMREIDARVKSYGLEPETRKAVAPDASLGLLARVRGLVTWLMRKDARNV